MVAESRIDELRRRLERDPGSRLFAQLAEEHRKAGELAEAIRVARAGLAVHAVYPSARLTLGRALLDTGDAAGARQELELALRQAPDNILASRYLAQALEQLGDRTAALRQFEAALAVSPGDQQLAAHVRELAAQAAGAATAPTGPMSRPVPPPVPASPARRAAGSSPELPVPTIRMAGVPPLHSPAAAMPPEARTMPPTNAPPAVAPATLVPTPPPAAAASAQVAAPSAPVREGLRPPPGEGAPPLPGEDDVAGASDAPPFSSSTLAELYLRQGLQERAVEVYRQVLAGDPGNERARVRLAALETAPSGSGPVDEVAARRRVLERTIAGLEAMLVSVRRR
jgi:tetratricopeptide (TPR) repeat protein